MYDVDHLTDYIAEQYKIYEKIILIYNHKSISIPNNFNYTNILLNLSDKYSNYLFIIFNNDDNIKKQNIISFYDIYKYYNLELPIGYGIQFSYLSLLVNKIICKDSGLCYYIFNNELKFVNKKVLWLTCKSLDQIVNKCNEYWNKEACVKKLDFNFETFDSCNKNEEDIIKKMSFFISN